jgi:hypothetical protein
MPHDPHVTATGKVTHLFAHRFVLETDKGAILGDLTPHGQHRIDLNIGDAVTIEGEMKPSELKVSRLTRGKEIIKIEHEKKHRPHDHEPADPAVVVRAAKDAGYETIGQPHRKPKHFEVLGRRNGKLEELHIELDGHIRKSKAVAADDPKWSARSNSAATSGPVEADNTP